MNWHITQSSYIISSPIHYFRKTRTIISQNPVTDNNVRKQVLYIAEIVTKLRKSSPPIVDSVRWVKIPGRYYRLPDTCTTTIAVITGICFCFFVFQQDKCKLCISNVTFSTFVWNTLFFWRKIYAWQRSACMEIVNCVDLVLIANTFARWQHDTASGWLY